MYQLVANKVIEKMKHDLQKGTPDTLSPEGKLLEGTATLAEQWFTFGVSRKTCKRSVMTLAYGSREYGFKEQLMEDIIIPAQKSMGDDFPFSDDGFTVEQSYKSTKELQIWTAINGKIRMYLNEPLDILDMRKQTSAISPNWIHSLDSSHLMMTVCQCVEEGIDSFAMIHDSFGTHACDTDKLFSIVRETFVQMYEEHDVLSEFKGFVAKSVEDETLLEELPDDLEIGDLDLDGVKSSMYCFA